MPAAPAQTRAAALGAFSRRLARSSSFRMMLLYAVGFTLSAIALLAIVAVTTDGFMTRQIDATVANELAELRGDAGGDDPTRLSAVIDELVRHSPGFFYLLQDPQRHLLAGNMMAIHPVPGPRSLEWSHQAAHGAQVVPVRGFGILLSNGDYLFVGSSAVARQEMRLSLIHAGLLSLGVIAGLGLLGGLLMSMVVLRRIEAVARTTQAIMSGDLSQRVRLNGSDDEFDHLAQSLNTMLARIESLMDGMRQISNDIAHDLRTPLTRLRHRLESASRSPNDAGALQAQLEAATLQVDAILATFTALLRLAQIEARHTREGFVPVDLIPMVGNLLDAFGPSAEERGQTLSAKIPDALVLRCDRNLLTQMLANLVDNALRHTQDGSRIVIRAETGPAAAILSVEDNGPGIPDASRDYVLRRFARLDASRNTPGNGLGLSLVVAIAALHEATLDLHDNHPGLVCRVAIPLDTRRTMERTAVQA